MTGVPGRDPTRELLWDAMVFWTGAVRGPGGADIGRVVISSVGSLPFALGKTSSRFTGMPNDMRCRLLIRDRVQLTGCIAGGVFGSKSLNSCRLGRSVN